MTYILESVLEFVSYTIELREPMPLASNFQIEDCSLPE